MTEPSKDRPPPYNTVNHKPEAVCIYPSIENVEDTKHAQLSLQEIPDEVKPSDTATQIKLVKNNFESLRKKLDQKEESVLENLESKISMGNPESENLVKQRENLFKTKLNLEESMQDPKLSLILADSYAKITAQLDCIDKQINVRKYIIWNISECVSSIENVCSVCETQDILGVHRGKKEVLWEKVQPGSERTQVIEPVGLAIEPQTDRIYIADAGNKRIQVFNNDGEHVSHIPVGYCNQIIFICFVGKLLFLIGEYCYSMVRSAYCELCTVEARKPGGHLAIILVLSHIK